MLTNDYNVYQQPTNRMHTHGDIYWELPNGRRHRLDGPAVEGSEGYKAWWVNGKRHRLDGPAIEWADGSKSWYIDNKHLTEQQWTLEVCRRLRDGQ